VNNYFKNANRGKTPVPQTYTPEHKRLGVQPVIYPVKDQEELEQMNRQAAMDPKFAAAKLAKGEMSQKEFDVIMQRRYSSQKPLVSSGESDEPIWIQSTAKKKESEKIRDEEVPLPPESPFMSVDEENESFTWDKIEPGEYVLLYQDNIVEIGQADVVIKSMEKIGGSMSDFIVLKRCGVSIG
jgi:hypothetical protein